MKLKDELIIAGLLRDEKLKTIADDMLMSYCAIKKRIERLKRKLGANTLHGLLRHYLDFYLLDIEDDLEED